MVKKIKQYRYSISHFIASEKGQRFFNFAYSIGAAIVIWGALFKILHLPGGNTLLAVGMGTEVMMFLLTAFDRPPREYKWEEVFPALNKKSEDDENDVAPVEDDMPDIFESEATSQGGVSIQGGAQMQGGTIIINGTGGGYAQVQGGVGVEGAPGMVSGTVSGTPASGLSSNEQYVGATPELADEMSHLVETTRELNRVHDTLLQSYHAITENASNITGNSDGYVRQMEALNHNIAALNTIYEIQLKSISGQLDSIDRVNRGMNSIRDMFEDSARQSARYCEEAEKMARNMQQLNQVYERMITAMTINMHSAGVQGAAPTSTTTPPPIQTTPQQ